MKSVVLLGIHTVQSALERHPDRIKTLYIDKRLPKQLLGIHELAKSQGISIQLLDKQALDVKSEQVNHQGVMVLFNEKTLSEGDLLDSLEGKSNPLLIILDEVQDPQNVGGILRSAAAFGVHAVVAPERNACALTPMVRKAACGGDLVVPFVSVTNLARFMRSIQEMGIWIVGTALDTSAKSIDKVDLKGPVALAMGAEGTGLRQNTLKHCDFIAHMPLTGPISSLNVSVATGICLYEAWRQRQ